MHAPNSFFQFKRIHAAANTYTDALTHTHTHTHVCCCTHPNDVEYALSTSTFSVPANACRGTHTHTHTHAHTCTLVYAHNLYAPTFTCTHKNDAEYATQVYTHTHPLLPYLHDVGLMLQIHVYGSSKCQQSYIHTDAPSPRFHTQNEVEYACSKSTFSV